MRIAGDHREPCPHPPASCLAVLRDAGSWVDWYPGVALARPAPGGRIEVVLDTGVPRYGTVEITLAVSEDEEGVGSERVAGRPSLVRARWSADGTSVAQSLELEIDTGLPGLVERPLRGRVHELVVRAPVRALAAEVRRRSGAGGA